MIKRDYKNIVTLLKDKIFRFARAILKDEAEAEDVTQDIFEKLWLNQEWIDKYENIESFLMRSTKNLCLDKIKHKNVVINSFKELKSLHNNSIEPKNEEKDISDKIKLLIAQLPEKQRIIIHLRDIEAYEFKEISELTGIDINAVRVSLSRARKAVKQELIKTINYGL
ncbi:MAG: RNA polymerase sigma factor [Bacteroidetes bacterium]|nr:RNA polymerase sigma factor [Bacteroidota bacterium]